MSDKTIRQATPREQEIHDTFLAQLEALSKRGPISITEVAQIGIKVNELGRRYGWCDFRDGVLFINEDIVREDIREKNPLPDPLNDESQKELLWHSKHHTDNLFQKLRRQQQ